jgi:hypothetical protein
MQIRFPIFVFSCNVHVIGYRVQSVGRVAFEHNGSTILFYYIRDRFNNRMDRGKLYILIVYLYFSEIFI